MWPCFSNCTAPDPPPKPTPEACLCVIPETSPNSCGTYEDYVKICSLPQNLVPDAALDDQLLIERFTDNCLMDACITGFLGACNIVRDFFNLLSQQGIDVDCKLWQNQTGCGMLRLKHPSIKTPFQKMIISKLPTV